MRSVKIHFFLFFCLIFNPGLYSIPASQKAFYAVSSLRFHISSLLTPKDLKTNIKFTEEDVDQLWNRALACPNNDLSHAKKSYDKAIVENDFALLMRAQEHLISAWNHLNPYTSASFQDPLVKGMDYYQYLLPDGSHLWKVLDKLFSDSHTLDTPQTFEEAGFVTISERPSGMFVASHPKLKGYLVKAYIHSKRQKNDWLWCINRCWGVANIRKLIEDKQLKHFVVPDKWIYPFLPFHNKKNIPEDLNPAILVVTDMQLVGRTNSKAAWRTVATYEHIRELYCILSHGYSSCSIASNIPYTIHGKFACIDTEHPQRPLPYDHVPNHLSPEMGEYWNYLVRTGGKSMLF